MHEITGRVVKIVRKVLASVPQWGNDPHMPQITANIKTDEAVKQARRHAIDRGVSLREWAGEIIETKLTELQTVKSKKRK